jgi:hypothetical protein
MAQYPGTQGPPPSYEGQPLPYPGTPAIHPTAPPGTYYPQQPYPSIYKNV